MKIAVSSTGKDLNSPVDPRFGRAQYFVIVDSDTMQVVDVIDNTSAQAAAHGAGINAATMVAQSGAEVVLTGRIGPKAFVVLSSAGIGVVSDMSGTVKDAVELFLSGKVQADGGPSGTPHQGQGGVGRGGGGGFGGGGFGAGRGGLGGAMGGFGPGMGGGRGCGGGFGSGRGQGGGRGQGCGGRGQGGGGGRRGF